MSTSTVFSHIVQRQLSPQKENVATEALAFIANASEGARTGLMKLLRGIAPALPSLRFRTQQAEGSARPDMEGLDGDMRRVLIENKFWAGLTDNQPITYLEMLAHCPIPAVLLMVVPQARQETVWRECERRLRNAGLAHSARDRPARVYRVEAIDSGPTLAITSWTDLLLAIEAELADEPHRRSDLHQLQALCDAADDYTPFSPEELTSQRTPAFALELNEIVRRAANLAGTKGILNTTTKSNARWEGGGYYITFPNAANVSPWFGTDFQRWRDYGSTPLWLVFVPKYSRPLEAQRLLEPWARGKGIDCFMEKNGEFVVGINVVARAEQEEVIMAIVAQLREVAEQLSPQQTTPGVTP